MSLLPNIITLLNLLCGAMAVLLALHPLGNELGYPPLVLCSICILIGAFFDLIDGRVARALHVCSPLGKELDSLADLVTFGMAPSAIYARILLDHVEPLSPPRLLLMVVCLFFLLLMSAYRLALFNVSDRQMHHFIGLPTPASALLTVGIALRVTLGVQDALSAWLMDFRLLFVVAIVQGVLLVAPVHLISFKTGRRLGFFGLIPYLLIALGGVLSIWLFGWLGLSITVLLYVLVCLFFQGSIAREG